VSSGGKESTAGASQPGQGSAATLEALDECLAKLGSVRYILRLTSVHQLWATPYAALVAMARAVVHYEDSKTATFSYWRKCGGCGVVSKLDLREPTPWHCPTGCRAETDVWLSGNLLREEPK
jgi:hypothetical protein